MVLLWYHLLLTNYLFLTLTGIAIITLYLIVLVGLKLYLDKSATVCDTIYYLDKQMHNIHIY
jgi:hypothetical protein